MNNGFHEPPLRHGGNFFILGYEYSTPKVKHTHNMLKKTFNVYKESKINQHRAPPLKGGEDVLRVGEGPTVSVYERELELGEKIERVEW